MIASIAPIAALLLSIGILLAGNGLQMTLLPIRAMAENFTPGNIGILGAAYFGGFVAGCFAGPALIRRVGHIRTFTAMVCLATAVVLGHGLFIEVPLWWALRFITGLAFAVLQMVIESWLNDVSSNTNRGRVISIYTIVNLLALTVGQQAIGLYDPKLMNLFSLAAILMALAALPVALTRAAGPAPAPRVRVAWRGLIGRSPMAFAGCAAVGLANGSFWGLGPVYATNQGAPLQEVAFFMSAAVLGGVLLQWPLGWLSDRIDRRIVLLSASIGASLAAGLAAFFSGSWGWTDLAFAAAFGAFAMPIYSICVAHMNDFLKPEEFVGAAAGLLITYGLAAVAGPLIAGLLIAALGNSALFAYIASVYALAALFALWRLRMGRTPPPDRVEEFVGVAAGTSLDLGLDPRAPEHAEDDRPLA